jgi:hypothetical protein
MVLGSYLAPVLFCDPPDLVLLVESQPQSPAPILTNETKKRRNEKQLQRAHYGMERERDGEGGNYWKWRRGKRGRRN